MENRVRKPFIRPEDPDGLAEWFRERAQKREEYTQRCLEWQKSAPLRSIRSEKESARQQRAGNRRAAEKTAAEAAGRDFWRAKRHEDAERSGI